MRVAVDLDARWTPEVFVLDSVGRVHYRGRVNDLYVSLGKHRPNPKGTTSATPSPPCSQGKRPETL